MYIKVLADHFVDFHDLRWDEVEPRNVWAAASGTPPDDFTFSTTFDNWQHPTLNHEGTPPTNHS